jgi:hypothetical protein
MTQNDSTTQQKTYVEELESLGEQVIDKIKELIREGSVQRIVIKQEGRTVFEFPLTFGVVGVFLAPTLAATGLLSALMAKCSIEVIRSEESTSEPHTVVEETHND